MVIKTESEKVEDDVLLVEEVEKVFIVVEIEVDEDEVVEEELVKEVVEDEPIEVSVVAERNWLEMN